MSASGARIALRTTLRDRCKSRAIALMAFPDACSRRILNTVSNTSIPISPPDTRQANSLDHRDEGSLFDADHPATGVPFPRRSTILSFAMFCLLAGLALRYDRWWLLLAAGAQLIALSTHFAGVAGSDALFWSIVSPRMVVWFELLLLAVFGVWEARAAPYAEKPYASAAADAARR